MFKAGVRLLCGALFQMMRLYFKLPSAGVPFESVSDEYNGENRGPGEKDPRPKAVRAFSSFDEAE